jgi:hypothetical protein
MSSLMILEAVLEAVVILLSVCALDRSAKTKK